LSVTGEHRSQRSIADEVGIEGPTLTHHLNRMETDGLVTRVRDPENRRVHQVALTDDGREVFHQLLGAVVSFDGRLRAGFTDDELTTLRVLLHRLAANAAAASDPAPRSRPARASATAKPRVDSSTEPLSSPTSASTT
jgi:MarR family transcriptional regulator for hemolysin